MAEKDDKVRSRKLLLIDAGYTAVDELIKVLKAPIMKGKIDATDELAAEKMKNAASAKKLALDDAFSILSTIQRAEEDLSETAQIEGEEIKREVDFNGPESRSRGK